MEFQFIEKIPGSLGTYGDYTLRVRSNHEPEFSYRAFSFGNVTIYIGKDMKGSGLIHNLWHLPENESGYGEYEFKLRMENDDSIRIVKGPWSSRPALYIKYTTCPNYIEINYNGQTLGMETDTLQKHLPEHIQIGVAEIGGEYSPQLFDSSRVEHYSYYNGLPILKKVDWNNE